MASTSNGEKKKERNLELKLLSNNSDRVDTGRTPDSEKNVRFDREESIEDGRSSSKSNKGRISRAVSIQRGFSTLTRKTMGFISINEDLTPEQIRMKQEKRKLLRQHHLEKFSRKPTLFSTSASKRGSQEVATTSKGQDSTDGHPQVAQTLADVVLMSQPQYYTQTVPRKRENAAKVLWKAANRSLSTRPRHDAFGGSSYLHSDLVAADEGSSVFSSVSNLDATDGAPSPLSLPVTPLYTPTLLSNAKFFDFTDHASIRDEPIREEHFFLDVPDGHTPHITPTIETCSPLELANNETRRISQWDREQLGKEPEIRFTRPGEVIQPTFYRTLSRGARGLVHIPELKKKKKKYHYNREYGKGRIGDFLNRSLDRTRINSGIERQYEDLSNHRPYFTYWLSFVQVVIIIVMLLLYPLAPIGVRQEEKEKSVVISRGGVLLREQLKTKTPVSFWIGPSIATLIRLGAKYAPCMRRDRIIFEQLDMEEKKENGTGCCVQLRYTGCIQRHYENCSSSSTELHQGKVCGQDPAFCVSSKDTRPQDWKSLNSFTEWPICDKPLDKSKKRMDEYPWMSCEVTGHPCCVRNQGQCIITTQNNCEFHQGVYHPEAALCSQVDCLKSTCGMLGFARDNEPDQFYRLFLSLFLNAGILHVLMVLLFNFTVLRDIEVMAGWLRTSLIFIISGIGGNLWSAILIPYEPEVGELGASFGIISCLFVEVLQGWSLVKHPCIAIGKLCMIMLVLFFLGLLPYIDNFAHIFGFIYGFFASLILLPYIEVDERDARRKRIQALFSIIVIIGVSTIGFFLFYNNYHVNASIIQYLNCVPIVENFCNNFHLGSNLEPREFEY